MERSAPELKYSVSSDIKITLLLVGENVELKVALHLCPRSVGNGRIYSGQLNIRAVYTGNGFLISRSLSHFRGISAVADLIFLFVFLHFSAPLRNFSAKLFSAKNLFLFRADYVIEELFYLLVGKERIERINVKLRIFSIYISVYYV